MTHKELRSWTERFLEKQKAQGKSEGTVKTYSRIIREFVEWLQLRGEPYQPISCTEIQQYLNHLKDRGNSPYTIENKLVALSLFFSFLGRIDLLRHIHRPEAPKLRDISPKALSQQEKEQLLFRVEQSKKKRNIAIVYMFLYTGLRVSEMVALNREDVRFEQKCATVHVKNETGELIRQVPCPAEAREHLKRYLDSREDDHCALFLSNYRQRISIRSVQRILEKYGIHPQQLRHTYCKELVQSGVDLATVAELAGHTDINMTRRYVKATVEDLEQVVEKAFRY